MPSGDDSLPVAHYTLYQDSMFLTRPDTGWAWVVMMASFSIFIIHGFLVFGYGMVQIALLERFEDGVAKTSLAGSFFTTFISCSGVLDGLMIRRFGCRLVAVSGGVMMTSGIFISAFMTSLNWIIFTYGVVAGFGAGMQHTAIIVTLGYNFERNTNLALGFAISGCGVGTFVITPVFAYLMTVYSLEGLFICLAGLSFQSVIFSSMFFPSSLEISHKHTSIKIQGNKASTTRGNKSDDSFCLTILNLFKTVPFLVLLLSVFVANVGTYIVYIHFANYTTHKGTTGMQTAFLLSVIGLCSFVSKLLAGLACNSKTIDEPTLLSGTLLIAGVFTALLPIYSHTYSGQIGFAVVFGLYAGCLYAIMNGITLRYLSLRSLGTAVGIELAVIGCGIMIGPPAIGLIIDVTGNYDIGFVLAGLCIIGGAFLTLVAELCSTTKQKREVLNLNDELTISLNEDVSPILETTVTGDELLSSKESDTILQVV